MSTRGLDDAIARQALDRRERECNDRRWQARRTNYRAVTWTPTPEHRRRQRRAAVRRYLREALVVGAVAALCVAVLYLLVSMVAPQP